VVVTSGRHCEEEVSMAERDEVLDVAIVGGGVGGVYSGWRLMTVGGRKRVTVFEESGRIGGRLLSAAPPGIPTMRAELGGMRILNSQKRITALVKQLGIGTYPFPVSEPSNIAYLRGVWLRDADFTAEPAKVPYRLSFQERGKAPGDVVVAAIEQILPGVTAMTPEERQEAVKTATFAGRPLWRQGFWQVLLRVMTNEAYDMSVQVGGYQSTLTSWNAADAIPWYLADFSPESEYFGFTDGYQTVPLTLASLFEQAAGKVAFGARLASFTQVETTAGPLIELRFEGRPEPVRARSLILAMPRRALELLEPTGTVLARDNRRVWRLIKSVTPQPMFKLFTAYRDPWWLAAGVEKGRSTTDLPVRQTYYWPNADGSPRTSGRALLMASYDDTGDVGFWAGLRGKRGLARLQPEERAAYREPVPFEGEPPAPGEEGSEWHQHKAPLRMVEEVQRQLAQIHALEYVPQPYSAAFMDWGDDPYGGGWNAWNIGLKSWEVSREILQPVEGVPVYICGEAYSRDQGWVEGALATADQVLREHFGVPPLV
jgi:monoamine oxidase